jgi:hypothetical protein
MSLRIGVGIGQISDLPAADELVNVAAGGAALERAREALECLETEGSVLTAFRSSAADMDQILNLVYRLHDAIVVEVTPTQWSTIKALEETEKGEVIEAAKKLGRNPSTVVRSLQRAHYHLLERTAHELETIIFDLLLHADVQ